MKVVYFVNQYPAVTHTFIRREIQALERLGVEVLRVAARCGGTLVDNEDRKEVARTQIILDRRRALLSATFWAVIARPVRFAQAARLMATFAKASEHSPPIHMVYLVEACLLARSTLSAKAHHIHAHFGSNSAEVACLASKIAGRPFSFTVHGYDEFDRPKQLALDAKTRHAAFVACVTFYGRSQMRRWCDDEDQKKIALVRCGLERTWATPTQPPGGNLFVCVGRLCREKGQAVLLEAVAALRARGQACELILIGDGPDRSLLEMQIAKLELTSCASLLGWGSGDEVRSRIEAARALVTPSFAENLPVVIMEAMALGRPVIASALAGIPELVKQGENGWLVPPSDADALVAALSDCLDASDSRLAEMGAAGRRRVLEQHDVDREAAELSSLFHAFAAERAPTVVTTAAVPVEIS